MIQNWHGMMLLIGRHLSPGPRTRPGPVWVTFPQEHHVAGYYSLRKPRSSTLQSQGSPTCYWSLCWHLNLESSPWLLVPWQAAVKQCTVIQGPGTWDAESQSGTGMWERCKLRESDEAVACSYQPPPWALNFTVSSWKFVCADILLHLIPNARLSVMSSCATISHFSILVTTVDKLVERDSSPQSPGEGHLEKNTVWLPGKR